MKTQTTKLIIYLSIAVIFLAILFFGKNASANYSVEYLIVAGGGGGGGTNGSYGTGGTNAGGAGGGGAGGMLTGSAIVSTGGSYPITIGVGGVGGSSGSYTGSNGGNSSVFSVTATGGGGGGGADSGTPGNSGGSGGGTGTWSGWQATGIAGQGYEGGWGFGNPGSGGGAGSPGVASGGGGTAQGRVNGYSGSNVYYSGGGAKGGDTHDAFSGWLGYQGGGGYSATYVEHSYSTPGGNASYYGGGGGGGHCNIGNGDNFRSVGGNGYQGIVIVRYLGAQRGTGGSISSIGGYTIHTFTGNGTFVDSVPTVSNTTISSSLVNPNNSTQYNIVVTGNNSAGGGSITHAYALVNYQGGNAGNYRGFPTWYYDATYTGWNSFKNKRSCSGGGIAAIQPDYGDSYINLDSCSTSVSGSTRTTTFVVHFAPSFTSPITNNDISGLIQNINGNSTGWVNFDTNFGLTFTPPSIPVISGATSGYVNTNYNYSFNSTDPNGYQIRYGIDWSMPSDGVADEWLPAGVSYVNSGVSQNTNHSWSTSGAKTFKALSQNYQGVNSAWSSPYSVSIAETPINGVCGSANKTYPMGSSSYGGDTYCSAGTPSSSPAFPSPGQSVNWTCLGSGGGGNSPQCTATLIQTTHRVTVTRTVGGNVTSSDGIINCGIGVNCYYDYNQGSNVTLTARPNSSYWKFNGWTGDCSGTSQCIISNIVSPKSIHAPFGLRLFRYSEF